jgi:hypothetical protein
MNYVILWIGIHVEELGFYPTIFVPFQSTDNSVVRRHHARSVLLNDTINIHSVRGPLATSAHEVDKV